MEMSDTEKEQNAKGREMSEEEKKITWNRKQERSIHPTGRCRDMHLFLYLYDDSHFTLLMQFFLLLRCIYEWIEGCTVTDFCAKYKEWMHLDLCVELHSLSLLSGVICLQKSSQLYFSLSLFLSFRLVSQFVLESISTLLGYLHWV